MSRRGEPHRGDGEGDAHQQHQALGDQGHQAGGRGLRRLDQVGAAQLEGEQQEHRQRHHHVGAGDDHPVDLVLQRRGRVAEGARLAGELAGVALLAHRVDHGSGRSPRCRRSRRAPGRRAPCGPRRPRRSASTRRASSRGWRSPRRRRRAGRRARPRPRRRARPPRRAGSTTCAVADHLRLRRDQHRQLVEGALRLQLLADADVGVDDRDQAEDRVGEEARARGSRTKKTPMIALKRVKTLPATMLEAEREEVSGGGPSLRRRFAASGAREARGRSVARRSITAPFNRVRPDGV